MFYEKPYTRNLKKKVKKKKKKVTEKIVTFHIISRTAKWMTPESSAFLQIWQITDLTRWSDSVPNDPLMSSEFIWYEKY